METQGAMDSFTLQGLECGSKLYTWKNLESLNVFKRNLMLTKAAFYFIKNTVKR